VSRAVLTGYGVNAFMKVPPFATTSHMITIACCAAWSTAV